MSEPTLSDLCSAIVDSEHKTAPKDPTGPYPLVRTSDLGLARADLRHVQRVNAETRALWTRRAVPTTGDLILAREAPVGGLFRVPDGLEPVLGQRTVLLRPDPDRVDGRFLMYRLASPDLQARMAEMSSGATVPHLNMADIRAFPMPALPSMSGQRRIAAALSAFDELIEVNERRIAQLEGLARSIYREWFVHFRFPGHGSVGLTESELGLVPSDWTVCRIADVAGSLTRGIAPKYAEDGTWTVINQRCIRDQRVTLTAARRHEGKVTDAKQLRFADVLINSTGVGTLGRVGVLLEVLGSMTADSHVTIVRAHSPELHPWFAMHMLSREPEFQSMGTGSTGQTELGRAAVGELPIAIPPQPLRDQFAAVAWPVLRPIPNLLQRCEVLAATRDLLLPRLVTGKLDISEIDLGTLEPLEGN